MVQMLVKRSVGSKTASPGKNPEAVMEDSWSTLLVSGLPACGGKRIGEAFNNV
jgi:hypothetical protein